MESLYSVPPLRLARVLCELRPEGIVSIPVEERGNLLRGTFGTLFRRLVCDPECTDAAHCPREGTCPHELLFAPRWPAGAQVGLESPPRAFLFRPPLESDPCFSAQHPLRFELRLFGEAISTAVLFLRSFQLLASKRDSDRRIHLASAFALDWDGNPCAELVRSGELTGAQTVTLDFASLFQDGCAPDNTTIEFLAPTCMREHGKDLRVPTFSALVCRVRDRVSMLCKLYEGKDWQASFSAIGISAGETKVSDWEGRWVQQPRVSSRTGQEMQLGGFRGSITCNNIDPRLWPLLRIGEEIHVGRHVTWGHGRYRLKGMTSKEA